MIRTVLTALFVLVAPGILLAGQTKGEKQKGKDNQKQSKAEQIKALRDEIHELQQQEKVQLKQIDEQFKVLKAKLEKPEEREKEMRAHLEQQEKLALKQIDERFQHILQHLEPAKVHQQLETVYQTLLRVEKHLSVGEYDYDGNRRGALNAVVAAREQVKVALANPKPAELARAGRDLKTAQEKLEKALAVTKKLDASDPKQARADRELAEALGVIETTHQLLSAVDHEVKDVEHEKKELEKKKEEIKKKVREEFKAKSEQLAREIRQQAQQVKELEHKKEELKKQVRERYAAEIKKLEEAIKQLK